MKVVLKKRALKALLSVALYVENINTPGSGERWVNKLLDAINDLAKSQAKFNICKHASLAKFKYSCYVYKDWVIAFKISGTEFQIHRIIHGSRLY